MHRKDPSTTLGNMRAFFSHVNIFCWIGEKNGKDLLSVHRIGKKVKAYVHTDEGRTEIPVDIPGEAHPPSLECLLITIESPKYRPVLALARARVNCMVDRLQIITPQFFVQLKF